MTCKECEKRWTYNLTCLACCVRLVESTRPSKQRAAAMLEVIARYREAPKREAILKELRSRVSSR